MRKKAANSTNRSQGGQRQPKKMIMSLIDGKQYRSVSSKEIKKSNDEYVSWGEKNTFPDHLWHLYSGCSTLQSIINGSTDMTFGNKVEFKNLPATFNQVNADGDTIEEVYYKLILDYWVFGGFAVQVQYNMLHEMTELIHLDLRRLRSNENKTKFFYSREWGTYNKGEAVTYYAYDQEDTEHHSQVLFYPGKKTRDLYPVPDWSSAIISAETQIEIKKFHYKTLINNFVVNGILNFFVGDVTDEVKEQTEKAINDKFCGTENAAQLLISWNKDVNQKIDFVRITDDQFDKKYEALSESVREDIFISLRAIPVLFGMVVQTGFNTQEYEEAFTLYNRIAIKPKQMEMQKVFDNLFGVNTLNITPFTLAIEEDVKKDNSSENINEIPDQVLNDLTQNERRELIGYAPIDDLNSNTSLLAERLGVGGTESFINVISSETITPETKREALKLLFDLSDEQVNNLIHNSVVR